MEDPLFEHVLGLPAAAAEERGRELLALLQLDRKVSLHGTAFTTTDLSQGQRRRLVLLAALLDDRPIVLLDEWAADQDPPFREFFYCELVPSLRAQGKTVIVITHDDRYFNRADRVLKIESGQLIASVAPDGSGRAPRPVEA
jgi:putative ATP-binding cassette transporter